MGAVTLSGPGVMVEVAVAVAVGVQVCPRESTQGVIVGVGVLEGAEGVLFPEQDKPIPNARMIPKNKPRILFIFSSFRLSRR